jgi:integrase
VSVLAYSGVRPQEALALRWSDIGAKTIRVDKAISLGQEKGTKTGKVRSVRLLTTLRDDLKEWRKVSGGKSHALVFPRPDGEPWNETDYRNWRRRVYRPLGDTVGIDKAQPYELRHSFASLLFQEGKTNHVDIAAQMGHNLQTLYSTYTHTIEELRDTPRQPVETLIRAARKKVASAKAAPILPQSTRTKKK